MFPSFWINASIYRRIVTRSRPFVKDFRRVKKLTVYSFPLKNKRVAL
nr:MAG TPA: hypothetical protein [Caudoviricetes sp.]